MQMELFRDTREFCLTQESGRKGASTSEQSRQSGSWLHNTVREKKCVGISAYHAAAHSTMEKMGKSVRAD